MGFVTEMLEGELKNLFVLINACCEARDNPAFAPADGVTHCNEAVHYIASAMGYYKLAGKLANDIIDFLESSEEWHKIPMSDAQGIANAGQLLIAGLKANPHGHVCVVRPGVVGFSGHWNVSTPQVVNIGETNFIGKAINFAFQNIPVFYMRKVA